MENKEDIQQTTSNKNKWYAPYIVAGLIIGGGMTFAKTLIGGELVLIGVAIGAFFLYYPLKSKIKIKNGIARVIITFLILFIGAGMSVGLVGGLINGLISKNGNQQRITECKGSCNFNPITKVWSYVSPVSEEDEEIVEKYGLTLVNSSAKYFQTQEQCLNYCLTQ